MIVTFLGICVVFTVKFTMHFLIKCFTTFMSFVYNCLMDYCFVKIKGIQVIVFMLE